MDHIQVQLGGITWVCTRRVADKQIVEAERVCAGPNFIHGRHAGRHDYGAALAPDFLEKREVGYRGRADFVGRGP